MSHVNGNGKKLALITVVYQNYSILKDFLGSVDKQDTENFSVFVSDLSDIKKPIRTSGFPVRIQILRGPNKGYASGVNLGLHGAIAEGYTQFCVINSDTYFKKDFVQNVQSSLHTHPSSIIAGKIYYAPGYEYHKTRYRKADLGKILWYAGGSVDWDNALTPHRGVDETDTGIYDRFEPVTFVNGCLMCFDKDVIDKTGFWDEKYFLYFEDADFCERAKQNNIPMYYVPNIVIWHKNAQSTGGSGSSIHLRYQKNGRLRFALKFAPLRTKFHVLKNYILSP